MRSTLLILATTLAMLPAFAHAKTMALNPQPLPPRALNPQPIPPGKLKALNPQPIPPGKSHQQKTTHKRKAP